MTSLAYRITVIVIFTSFPFIVYKKLLWKVFRKSIITIFCKQTQERSLNYILTVCSCHVMYAFQSESTLYSCLNVKELLARSRRKIWRLSDCKWTRTQNCLVRKRTLNHLAKRLSVRLQTKWFWVRIQLQSLKLYTTCYICNRLILLILYTFHYLDSCQEGIICLFLRLNGFTMLKFLILRGITSWVSFDNQIYFFRMGFFVIFLIQVFHLGLIYILLNVSELALLIYN